MTQRQADFISEINKILKSEVATMGVSSVIGLRRFPTGCFGFDVSLGGGIPFERTSILAGDEGYGKSLLCMAMCRMVRDFDHETKLHRSLVDPAEFQPGIALYLDTEAKFDKLWAIKAFQFHGDHVRATPYSSEDTCDIITKAIEENVFDLIILDSIAGMMPIKDLEASAHENSMALAARVNAKGFAKWTAAFKKLLADGKIGPALVCVNQFRTNVGVMFGDPRVMPGGKAQRFAASTISYLKSPKLHDVGGVDQSVLEISGSNKKNATNTPKRSFSGKIGVRHSSKLALGEFDTGPLTKAALEFGVIEKVKSKYEFDGHSHSSQSGLMSLIKSNQDLFFKLYAAAMVHMTDFDYFETGGRDASYESEGESDIEPEVWSEDSEDD